MDPAPIIKRRPTALKDLMMTGFFNDDMIMSMKVGLRGHSLSRFLGTGLVAGGSIILYRAQKEGGFPFNKAFTMRALVTGKPPILGGYLFIATGLNGWAVAYPRDDESDQDFIKTPREAPRFADGLGAIGVGGLAWALSNMGDKRTSAKVGLSGVYNSVFRITSRSIAVFSIITGLGRWAGLWSPEYPLSLQKSATQAQAL